MDLTRLTDSEILEIAHRIRGEIIEYYGDPKAVCLEASRELEKCIPGSKVIQGKFRVDNPDLTNYDEDDWDNDDLDEPLHYWLKVNGKVLDITADQFNEEIDSEIDFMPEVFYGLHDRYIYS